MQRSIVAALCFAATLAGCSAKSTTDEPVASAGAAGSDASGGAGNASAGSGPVQLIPGEVLGPSGFRHPGVLVNRAQLDLVKAKLAQDAEPWASALKTVKASPYASLDYVPHPVESVDCGPYSDPDHGCSAEQGDAIAAYTHALLWVLTGDEGSAKKSVEIMDAWSSMLKTHTLSNALPQSGWTGSVFTRAAEVMRYSYDGWPTSSIDRFASMLKTAYLPITIAGTASTVGGRYGLTANGNWEAVMIEASTAIAVFTDDRATFDTALDMWRARTKSYIYLKSDGPEPISPPGPQYSGAKLVTFWGGQAQFSEDGMGQEACRDFHHLEYGFAGIVDTAETALIQGVDLYTEQGPRIVAGLEFNAQFLNGTPIPSWLCNGMLDLKSGHSWEIAYNEYANRQHLDLPNTKQFVASIRPTDADHHMVWETLTHAEVGSAGVQ